MKIQRVAPTLIMSQDSRDPGQRQTAGRAVLRAFLEHD
jgi:hypothetical protein